MKNNKLKYIVLLCGFALVAIGIGCSPDDPDFVPVPPRDRTEQQITDNDSLLGYFETHYYNYAELQSITDISINDIVISELPKDENGNYLPLPDPDNNRLLMGNVEAKNTTLQDVDYVYYILKLNQGGGEAIPNFTDGVRIAFSGNLQNGTVFDSTANPTDLDLTNLIAGWNRVLPQFNVASSFAINGDGTVSFSDYGVGVMFIPSGLAFFDRPPFGVPIYSNLIFKFELYQTEVLDHDNDGIPSFMEDLNGDFFLLNDDTDGNNIPNYLDADDDGDGVPTRDEIIINPDGTIDFPDSNGNGMPDYLDATFPNT